MKKLLLTGFSVFSTHKENSSEILVKMLQARGIDGFEIKSLILPVSYTSSFSHLENSLDQFKPDLVIAFGLAEKRNKISLEKVALNLMDSEIPDNDGVVYRNKSILEKGESALFSTLEIEKMRMIIGEYPVELSLSAGAYLCNYIMYRLLDRFKFSSTRAGFIHLPHLNNNAEEIYRTVVELIRIHE